MEQAIIIGFSALAFLGAYLWDSLRGKQQNLSLIFLSLSLVFLNTCMWTIAQIMENSEKTYFFGYGLVVFYMVMWLTILVAVYILIGLIVGTLKVFINWLWLKIGWKAPFTEKRGMNE